MKRAGFNNVDITANGKECWDKLTAYEQKGVLDEKVACVITDIEMPQMVDHHLTKLIKSNENMAHIPGYHFLFSDQHGDAQKGRESGSRYAAFQTGDRSACRSD